MDWIEIRWTAGSLDEARRVARYLVQERLVVTARIIPWIESISMWNNQLETAQESQIALITSADQYEKVKEVILQNSSYEIPEILFTQIAGGHEDYFKWLQENVQKPTAERANQ